MSASTTYTERSWAIDLISHINSLVSSLNRPIQGAGGEQSVGTTEGRLFPDVLLFGDRTSGLIMQGWELKMPDTAIDAPDLICNARRKAIALDLDSFVVWNVSEAQLHVREKGADVYTCSKKWLDLAHITSRDQVSGSRSEWKQLATKIIDYLNDMFDNRSLGGRQFWDVYKSGGIAALIMENSNLVRDAIEGAAKQSRDLRAEIDLWWVRHKLEYGGISDPYSILAQANIWNWIGKFLFAYILQETDNVARGVCQIGHNETPQEALRFFERLSARCNFWTIFAPTVGLSVVADRAWDQILQFNALLAELRVSHIEQSQLSDILEATVDVAVRKLRGQYTTPAALANLLVGLCINNIETDRLLDPCCGSGTIARAALQQKLDNQVLPERAASQVFAGDLDPQAVQIATFALAQPKLMNVPLRVYQKDLFQLKTREPLTFRHPQTGKEVVEETGEFDSIITNPPFVGQDGRDGYRKAITSLSSTIGADVARLPTNSDVTAYVPFCLHPLLAPHGRLGLIVTNAWLGTGWGEQFFGLIQRYFILRFVITSGAGRWFQNSDVVANILILDKKNVSDETNPPITFVVLMRRLENLTSADEIRSVVAQILQGSPFEDTIRIRTVSQSRIQEFHRYGLGSNAQFVDCDWVLSLPLVPVSRYFAISRGERRGWNEMFYPGAEHGIEAEYIKPVLRTPRDVSHYTVATKEGAFSCSRTVAELQNLGHSGAINWIRRFEGRTNPLGRPLPEVLSQPGKHWYEMSTDAQADLAMPLNFGTRLFIAQLRPRAFVDQRLIQFGAYDGIDIDLCFALLNCSMSLFMIEAMGFGRALGALDLSKNKVEKFMHMLDPNVLSDLQAEEVKKAFGPLRRRKILDILTELEQEDRQNFDNVVKDVFEIEVSTDEVYECLRRLVDIRQCGREA